jgi:diaminopimelate epimerase
MIFEKWEGLGNDFIVLQDPLPGAPQSSASLPLDDATVRALCDRRFGIGADGVLVVEGAATDRPRMIVRNADGSRPEMCGNGIRCVAGALGREGIVVIGTDAGDKTCEVRRRAPHAVDVVVEMGPARRGEDLVAEVDGAAMRFLTIDMGNPHVVTFDLFGDEALERVGPRVGARVPGGTNVELCTQGPDEIAVLVWERGVGRTLACGTGACAVAAAACETGRASFGAPIRVRLPGGVLEITVAKGGREVRMRGPARRVFTGEVVRA